MWSETFKVISTIDIKKKIPLIRCDTHEFKRNKLEISFDTYIEIIFHFTLITVLKIFS